MKRKAKIEIIPYVHQLTAEGESETWHRWRLKGATGEIVCWSEYYAHRGNAVRSARRAVKLMAEAEIK